MAKGFNKAISDDSEEPELDGDGFDPEDLGEDEGF